MTASKTDPYKIVINWDEGAMYNFLPVQAASERDDVDAPAIKAMLEQIVDEHAKADVDVLVHGVFSGFMCMMPYPRLKEPVGGGVHVPATVQEHLRWVEELGTFWLAGFKKLSDAGLDIVQIIFDRCRRHGMKFVVGFRMNDRHAGSGQKKTFYPRVQQFAREHPEWLLKEYAGGLDYRYEGVRNAVLQFIEEAIERYDLDGIELDWMRWCHMFPTAEAAASAPCLTDLTAKVRAMLDAAAAQRGRERLLLGARVAQTMDECTNLGYDVKAWIDQGLVDYLCPSDFYQTDFNAPTEQFTALVEGTACEIYPSIHPSLAWSGNRLPQIEEYRAAARNFYTCGAHGVSPYNYMYHWGKIRSSSYPGPADMWPKSMDWLAELRHADRIARGDRRYCFQPLWLGHREGTCPTGAWKSDQLTVDRSADDPHGTFVFRMAEDLTDPNLSATLVLKIVELFETDELEVRINGRILPAASIETRWRIYQGPLEGRTLGAHMILRTKLSSPPARHGDNELGLRLLNRVGMENRRLKVQEIEVFVEVRA